MTRTFILIHGGFHGGWCWERVVPLIEAAGHRVLAPDLPGMAGDTTPHSQVSLASQADFVVDLLRAQSEPAVLVGHSMGGMVIGEAAERAPERILGLVFVTAVMMLAGGEMPMPEGAPPMTISEDGHSMMGDLASAPEILYTTTDPEIAAAAVARLTPQPVATTGPLTTTVERMGSLPRAYVECIRDQAIAPANQRAMQAALPCDPVFTLETDHSPFYSAPERLAECLLAAGASFAEA